ncbi:helix-turn-helix transcriptional regulator [Clostridium sp. HBUAS56017]|uniref:helix-turn-helix domain-containing protein n=1 Tax=Clostridium sp. HBUAS56017 TaxID=2571128 RepID=UPI0011786E06|nr:helix-turn-helix transcriptional regulator [Clostridium sp. HBUAS56017]
MIDNINEIKLIKNNIYNEISLNFIYNLKKLIQIEGTQKNLSLKIGISEDLLSKYKSGSTFPTIETLIYISKIYKIKLNDLLYSKLKISDLESINTSKNSFQHIFREKYFVYFLVTNKYKEGTIQEGVIEFHDDDVCFNIIHENSIIKSFEGNYKTTDKLIFFELTSVKDGICYINMIKPNVNMKKYIGGIAMMLLPSQANSKPCCQKILFSKDKINREENYEEMSSILNFNTTDTIFGNIKISINDDEDAFDFITSLAST